MEEKREVDSDISDGFEQDQSGWSLNSHGIL